MTVLIDTNVILDFILKRKPFDQDAMSCFDALIINKAKAWLTANTITDIYYITKKALQDGVAAKEVIAKLLNAFQIASVDKADCVKALEADMDDYEDALVSVCAKKVKAEYILTRNTKHFGNSSVQAIKPVDFLKIHTH